MTTVDLVKQRYDAHMAWELISEEHSSTLPGPDMIIQMY